ncbi:MAG: phosphate/phosphite/phosphonate ABC transporter substrate-binding protein [Isosphaeraceae bacterium]
MRSSLLVNALLAGCLVIPAASYAGEEKCPASRDASAGTSPVIRIGAVAYSPSSVTVFESLRRYLGRQGLVVDYTLYSNYDALVDALSKNHVDVAWNTPLAHAKFHRGADNKSQTLVMRDVDCNVRSMLVVRADADIRGLDDLKGKTLILGSRDAAEATVLPLYFLRRDGVDETKLKVLSLDKEVDLRGNPCSSENHVLKALQEGRGQAGVIGERLWARLSREQPDQVSGLKTLWVSPAFSHCVFTASKSFDRKLGEKFTALMLAMKPDDADAAEVLRLEGARRWVAGGQDGFQELHKALSACEVSCCSDAP